MAGTAALVAIVVYEWLGVALLRRAWLNVDLLWTCGLIAVGGLLLSQST